MANSLQDACEEVNVKSNGFHAIGNLGKAPVQKTVNKGGESHTVVELSVKVDRRVPDGDGGYVNRGDFWLETSIWRPSLQERVMAHLKKGARVFVMGELVASPWTDEHDQKRMSYQLNADYVAPDLLGVDSITFGRRGAADDEDDQQDLALAG